MEERTGLISWSDYEIAKDYAASRKVIGRIRQRLVENGWLLVETEPRIGDGNKYEGWEFRMRSHNEWARLQNPSPKRDSG